jgi:WD40 repeat protein
MTCIHCCSFLQTFAQDDRQLLCLGSPGTCAILQCAFQHSRPPQQASPALVATCSRAGPSQSDPNVCVWDSETGRRVCAWRAGDRDAVAVAWSPCGTLLAAAACDPVMRVWRVDTGEAVMSAAMPHAVMCVGWSKDGALAVGMSGGPLRIVPADWFTGR